MSDETVRVTCVADNCGTFPMDAALVDRLKRTGDPFTCPAGHQQHFTESPEKQLRERVQQLEREVDRLEDRVGHYRENAHDAWDDLREERTRRKHAESLLLSYATGVVEVAPDEYKWACECDARGQKAFDSVENARDAFEAHQDRMDCDGSADEAPAEEVEQEGETT